MSTDPAEVAAAMDAGQAAEQSRQADGVPAVSAPPPFPPPEPQIQPLAVHEVGTLSPVPNPEEVAT